MNKIKNWFAPFFTKEALPFFLSGASLAGASLVPETVPSLLFAIATAFLFAHGLERSLAPLRHALGAGVLFTAVAFYWLPATLSLFGGFPSFVSYFLFGLFCLSSGLQFVLLAAVWLKLRGSFLSTLGLALPLSWLLAELVFPRLFPWAIGHALVAWPDFAALGAYVGVPLCSVLIVWWGAYLHRILFLLEPTQRRAALLLFFGVTSLLFVLGSERRGALEEKIQSAAKLKVALIQGNLDVLDKGNIRLLNANIKRYQALSVEAVADGAELILWPESVSNYWTPEDMPSLRNTKYDPFPPGGAAMLYGGLSFREREREEYLELLQENPSLNTPQWREQLRFHRFNSVFAIDSSGTVLGKYHKRVLMPFGEYVPFSSRFPVLKTLLPQTGDFSFGDLTQPITFPELKKRPVGGEEIVPRIASLICYEDLIPSLSAEAVAKGAHLLVNQTNDAWYGDTAEPYQHHLLAQWRAIESGRSLLRVTNTGFTAVVNPHGQTVSSLPLYSEGALLADVPLMSGETLYAKIGDTPAWSLVVFTLIFAVLRALSRGKKRLSEGS